MKPYELERGRIFLRDESELTDALRGEFDSEFEDAEDAEREPLLREAICRKDVVVTAARLVALPDVYALYVGLADEEDAPLFACTVVTEPELIRMLGTAPAVFENMTLEVVLLPKLSRKSLEDAFRSWANRNFSDVTLGKVSIRFVVEDYAIANARKWGQEVWDSLAPLPHNAGWIVCPPSSPDRILSAVSHDGRRTVAVNVGEGALEGAILRQELTIRCAPSETARYELRDRLREWILGHRSIRTAAPPEMVMSQSAA